MTVDLECLLPLFWKNPEYANAWRMCFAEERNRRALLQKLVKCLPNEWGHLDFYEDTASEQLILLFTHDFDNDSARKNEFRILSTLINTGAVSFFGTEGTTGRIDLDRYRAFPNQQATQIVSEYLFRTRRISPLVAAMFVSPMSAEAWGVEDPELYDEARSGLLGQKGGYWDTIARRVPVLLENFLLKMREENLRVAGAAYSEHNYWEIHELLQKKGVAHLGVSSVSEGETEFGRAVEDIRKAVERADPLEKLFQEPEEEQQKRRDDYNRWKQSHGGQSSQS